MLSPLDAVVPVQFLKGPLLPLSATIGFQQGGVPLEWELQTTTFTSLNSPDHFLPAGQLTPRFTEKGGYVTVLLMEQLHSLKSHSPEVSEELHDWSLLTSVVHPLIW